MDPIFEAYVTEVRRDQYGYSDQDLYHYKKGDKVFLVRDTTFGAGPGATTYKKGSTATIVDVDGVKSDYVSIRMDSDKRVLGGALQMIRRK